MERFSLTDVKHVPLVLGMEVTRDPKKGTGTIVKKITLYSCYLGAG